MKFRITRSEFDLMAKVFDGKHKEEVYEINLEPADQTAARAIYEQSLKNESFKIGHDMGYREGWYDRDKCRSFYHKDGYCITHTCGCHCHS